MPPGFKPRTDITPSKVAVITLTSSSVPVRLVSSRGSEHSMPGQVPPGTYVIEAQLKRRRWEPAGELRLAAGQTLKLHCSVSSGTCQQR